MQRKHTTEAIVIACVDFRFQKFVDDWLLKNIGRNKYDRVGLAGGVFDFYTVLKQVEISVNLHHITKVILMNHENCGAYGAVGTRERHIMDLTEAERKVEALFPGVDVETYYIALDGTFEEVSRTNRRTV